MYIIEDNYITDGDEPEMKKKTVDINHKRLAFIFINCSMVCKFSIEHEI